MSSVTVAPTPFAEVSTLVRTFIAETDQKPGNSSIPVIESANHLLIAITNADNIFQDCPVDQQPILASKMEEFRQMIASLPKVDLCRSNLTLRIDYSIHSGTANGWLPKLYAVYPLHGLPTLEFTVQFIGKFKYADREKYGSTYSPRLVLGEETFQPTEAGHHRLTFKPSFKADKSPYQPDKCSQFFAKLIVPYEVGNLGLIVSNQRTYEFIVPIRALPTNPGKIELAFREASKQCTEELKMGWGESRIISNNRFTKLTFTTFDGKKQEFIASDLQTEAKKSNPVPLIRHGTYLTISQVAGVGEESKKWEIKIVPPIDI